MPRRINVPDRIVAGVGVAVEALRVVGIWDYCIGLGKAAKFGVVVSGTVVVEFGTCIKERCCSSFPLFEKAQPTEKFPGTDL